MRHLLNISKNILPIALCAGTLAGVLAQGLVTPAAQPEKPTSEPRRPERSETSAKPPGSSSKKSSSSTARRGQIEVRSFAFDEAFGGQRFSRPLIIRHGRADAKQTAELQEDLQVMSRIFEKAVVEHADVSPAAKAAGIDILALTGGGKTARTLYLDGYGVLFTLAVNIPLKNEFKPEDIEEKDPARNEEWEDARNEVFGQKRRAVKRGDRRPAREFDQAEVDELKDSLIESLSNVSNIRGMKGGDWVTIVVRGARQSDDGEFFIQEEGRMEGHPAIVLENSNAGGSDSMMIIRIKKEQIDDLAKKKAGKEEIEKNLSITIY